MPVASSRWGAATTVLAIATLISACSGGGGSTGAPAGSVAHRLGREPRDLLLVTIDTLRYDATGFSGEGRVRTPVMDRLASEGVVFSFSHAHAVVTLPSHASILTGLYPYEHGIHDNAGFALPENLPTLATVLRSAGYATAAFVSAFPLDRRFGLGSGFDTYDDEYEGHGTSVFTVAERPGEETVERAKRWWDAKRGSRRFLWVHLFTPHFPYEPTEPYASDYRDAPYYGEAALADAQLAPLLEPLLAGEDAPTLVVLTSDHGESLGEHDEQTHGLFAYEATLRVPLVFWAPGLVAPGVVATGARHVDILPSVADLLGLTPPPGLPGASLFDSSSGAGDRGSYFEALSAYFNRSWAPLRGRLEDHVKAIDLPMAELYDLREDPHELTNLATAQPEDLSALIDRLPGAVPSSLTRGPVDEETIERLRSLGYVAAGSGAAREAEYDESRDPKVLIELEHLMDEALSRYRSGDAEGAIGVLRSVLSRDPRMAVAYSHLGYIYQDLGRTDAAIELLTRAASLGVSSESLRTRLALALLRAGRPQRAWDELSADRESRNPEVQSALGRIAAARGRPEEARSFFQRALEIDPTFPTALVDLGVLAMTQERFDEAVPYLEEALDEDASLAEGWNALGVIRSRRGDARGAIEAWERAIEADPRLTDALFNLAVTSGAVGNFSRAIAALERYTALVSGDERRRAEAMLEELRSRTGGAG